MATYTGSGERGYSITFTVNETGTSIDANTSTISYSLVVNSNNYSFSDYETGWRIYINGSQVSYRSYSGNYASMSSHSSLTLASGTTTVVHDNDGTKTINVSAYADIALGSYGPGDMSASGTLKLTDIPRSSTLTIPSLVVGSAATLTVTAANPSFSHVITYSFHDTGGTIGSLAAGVTTISWTPPSAFYAKMPNVVSDTVNITIQTLNNGTPIGSRTYNATATIDPSIKPTAPSVTLTPVNYNYWIDTQGLYVGGYSRIKVQSSASPGTGATMASYTISGAFSGTGADVTSGVLTEGAKSITVTATDSRGRASSTVSTVTFLEYSPPSLNITAERGIYNGSWTSDVNGDHIRITAVPVLSLSNEGNTPTVTAKVGGASPDIVSGNYYIWTSTDATTTYNASVTVTDSVGNSASRTASIPTIEVPFNVNVDLPGAAFGMISQTAEVVEIGPAWAMKFGNTLVPDTTQGNKVLGMNAGGTALEWKTIFDLVYPVGSIYMSVNNTNPGTLFGGTWVAWGTGRTPVAVDTSDTDFDTVEKTGGDKTHSHEYGLQYGGFWYETIMEGSASAGVLSYSAANEISVVNSNTAYTTATVNVNSAAGESSKSKTANIYRVIADSEYESSLQPYITCYMWKRTA